MRIYLYISICCVSSILYNFKHVFEKYASQGYTVQNDFFLLFFVQINDRFKTHKCICLKKYESCSMKGKSIYEYNPPYTDETGVPMS